MPLSFKSLINENDTARLLGISVKTLQNQRYYSKGLEYVKIGRAIRYKVSVIEEYVAKHTVQPYAEA